jgi:hypothetical protein
VSTTVWVTVEMLRSVRVSKLGTLAEGTSFTAKVISRAPGWTRVQLPFGIMASLRNFEAKITTQGESLALKVGAR